MATTIASGGEDRRAIVVAVLRRAVADAVAVRAGLADLFPPGEPVPQRLRTLAGDLEAALEATVALLAGRLAEIGGAVPTGDDELARLASLRPAARQPGGPAVLASLDDGERVLRQTFGLLEIVAGAGGDHGTGEMAAARAAVHRARTAALRRALLRRAAPRTPGRLRPSGGAPGEPAPQ